MHPDKRFYRFDKKGIILSTTLLVDKNKTHLNTIEATSHHNTTNFNST